MTNVINTPEEIDVFLKYLEETSKPDLSKVEINIINYIDNWEVIKKTALFTMGLKSKKGNEYPNSEWKNKILRSQHSPIRYGYIIVEIKQTPQHVHGHLTRHHNGVVPEIRSLRDDRAKYNIVPNRNTLQDGLYWINFDACIYISRKRCCYCASNTTRTVWRKFLDKLRKYEPELFKLCVKECVYRGGLCPEVKTCQYNKTESFKKELKEYQSLFDDQICDDVKLEVLDD